MKKNRIFSNQNNLDMPKCGISTNVPRPFIHPFTSKGFFDFKLMDMKKAKISSEGLYSIEFTFIFTFVIWALVTVRKGDVKEFF